MARYRDGEVRYVLSFSAGKVGYSLRPLQELVIISFVQGRDVSVGLPTGSGKSLCYSLLPDVYNLLQNVKSSIVVVVIALMKDQVQCLLLIATIVQSMLCARVTIS